MASYHTLKAYAEDEGQPFTVEGEAIVNDTEHHTHFITLRGETTPYGLTFPAKVVGIDHNDEDFKHEYHVEEIIHDPTQPGTGTIITIKLGEPRNNFGEPLNVRKVPYQHI